MYKMFQFINMRLSYILAATYSELFVVVHRILFELKQFLISLEQKMFEQIS